MEKKQSELLTEIISIIDQGKQQVAIHVNSGLLLVFWQVGQKVNQYILGDGRAAYGKQVVQQIASDLVQRYGRNFEEKNLRRMLQFAHQYESFEKVVTLSRQLSWSHVLVLLPIKNEQAKMFYTQKIVEETWSVRFTRKQIERKAFERKEIASSQLPDNLPQELAIFKDPYFLDFLGLKEGYLEKDLEAAILKDLEEFILELGMGFTFVERQKRMIIDGEDHRLDLLFYHRKLRRLVAIELKIGKFKAKYKGQMELYLKWLDKYDKQEQERMPIGLILCAETSREQVELLEMHKDGIMVAEYWTDLPSKASIESRLHLAMQQAREQIARREVKAFEKKRIEEE